MDLKIIVFKGNAMIKKIDNINFGSYKNYKWSIGDNNFFGCRNVIYGRNYSGKTTFSRIFRSLEKKEIYHSYSNASFKIMLEDGSEINSNDIKNSNLKVRVYNSDFRKEKLKFLEDENGEVTPFAIIGKENKEIEEKIHEKNIELEKIKDILYVKEKIIEKFNKMNTEKRNKNRELDQLLKKKASDIRNDTYLFKADTSRRYDIRDLYSDIDKAKSIQEEEIEKFKNIIDEKAKVNLTTIDEINIDMNKINDELSTILKIQIKPSSFLFSNSDDITKKWIINGVEIHKANKSTCKFCNNEIDESRWSELDNFVSKNYAEINGQIKYLLDVIKNNFKIIDQAFHEIDTKEFYIEFHDAINENKEKLFSELSKLKTELIDLQEILLEKKENIFKEIEEYVINDDFHHNKYINNINDIIIENNKYTQKILKMQDEKRLELRYNNIYHFLNEVDYNAKKNEIERLESNLSELEKLCDEKKENEKNLKNEIDILEKEKRDEKQSVRLINDYLRDYLGHLELYLDINTSEENQVKFQILRNNEIAYNLSEGEQSLISFSYFIASLKEIEETDINETIIFIDDPISSLDNSNIFSIFSLLDSEVAKKNYKQVFISTHNLDFLKYLQRLSAPSTNKKYKIKYYMTTKTIDDIESKNYCSNIIELPKYLEKYATEYMYLFEQIHVVATQEQCDENMHVFYSFPNCARKFLETYLYFKYPDHNIGNDRRLLLFFDENTQATAFINRINNEYSHGENQPDRLMKPMDISEMKKNAQLILHQIKTHDLSQYESFLNNINHSLQSEN